MATEAKHISVCICTFKRPGLLKRLLYELDRQHTRGLFSYSLVVVDNDRMRSAQQVVTEFAATSSVSAIYRVEPEQNIARARNKTLENAKGDFIAFIDDDEFPVTNWLYNLFKTCEEYEADGVLGPVKAHFEHEPPQWVRRGKFFERPLHDTGSKLHWSQTRTGNVLFKKEILSGIGTPFKPELGTGSEDVDFFMRTMKHGRVFVWCNEAAVYEVVPPSRCTRRYLLRRALVRGSNFPKRATHLLRNLAKSTLAVPLYALALPLAALCGQHVFLKYLIKFLDHASRLLAFLGLRLATGRGA